MNFATIIIIIFFNMHACVDFTFLINILKVFCGVFVLCDVVLRACISC